MWSHACPGDWPGLPAGRQVASTHTHRSLLRAAPLSSLLGQPWGAHGFSGTMCPSLGGGLFNCCCSSTIFWQVHNLQQRRNGGRLQGISSFPERRSRGDLLWSPRSQPSSLLLQVHHPGGFLDSLFPSPLMQSISKCHQQWQDPLLSISTADAVVHATIIYCLDSSTSVLLKAASEHLRPAPAGRVSGGHNPALGATAQRP